MALSKTVTKVIDNQTISAYSYISQATGTDLSSAINLVVSFTVTFNASANSGARIEIYADPAGASAAFTVGTYDVAMDSGDVAISKGHTVSGSFQMNWGAKFIKVRMINLDTGYSITVASAWVTVQTP